MKLGKGMTEILIPSKRTAIEKNERMEEEDRQYKTGVQWLDSFNELKS